MNKLLLSTLTLVAVATFAAPTHAAPPDLTRPLGQKCTMGSATDVTNAAGWHTGFVRGGPLLAFGAGTLVCTIHLNNDAHSAPYATPPGQIRYAATGLPGLGGAFTVGGPTPVTFKATAADSISICTEWRPVTGPTLYWVADSPTAARFGYWSLDPGSTCAVPDTMEPNDPECSIWKAIDNRAGTPLAETWQDCEPYDPII